MRSGFVAVMASMNDVNGFKPSYAYFRRVALIVASGWREGQTDSTLKPASARDMPSRAVGTQRSVVAINTVGLTALQAPAPSRIGDAFDTTPFPFHSWLEGLRHSGTYTCCSPSHWPPQIARHSARVFVSHSVSE